MMDITDLANRSSHRRHLDKMLFRTDIGQEETKNPKPKQLQQIGPKKPLPIAKDDLKRSQESGEANHNSDEGKDEKKVEAPTDYIPTTASKVSTT